MPIILDFNQRGDIISGHFYSYIPDKAVESGIWQPIIPGAVYARAAHFMEAPMSLQRQGPVGTVDVPQAKGAGGTTQGGGQGVEEPGKETQPNPTIPHPSRDLHQSTPSASPPSPKRGAPPATPSPKRRRLTPPTSMKITLPIAIAIEPGYGRASIANTANAAKGRAGKEAAGARHVSGESDVEAGRKVEPATPQTLPKDVFAKGVSPQKNVSPPQSASPPKSLSPKRKVVRAGDETETDVSESRRGR